MDWSKVNWFAFFPPVFSIYLLFISGLIGGYLAGQVRHAAAKLGRGGITPATMCKAILLLVNVGLIIAIAWSQQLSPPK